MMHGRGKSDFAIVAVKPANKADHPAEQSAAEPAAAEPVERRAETKGNANQQSTCRTQSRVSVSQALERIRQAFAVMTRGRSRMRESCKYGSARGAPSNGRPYRDRGGSRSFAKSPGRAHHAPARFAPSLPLAVRRMPRRSLKATPSGNDHKHADLNSEEAAVRLRNMTATQNFLDRLRDAGHDPDEVFASSVEGGEQRPRGTR